MTSQADVLFEFRRHGSIVRVSAIDAELNLEIVLAGPASGGLEPLKRAALAKLAYARRRLDQSARNAAAGGRAKA